MLAFAAQDASRNAANGSITMDYLSQALKPLSLTGLGLCLWGVTFGFLHYFGVLPNSHAQVWMDTIVPGAGGVFLLAWLHDRHRNANEEAKRAIAFSQEPPAPSAPAPPDPS